MRLFTLLKTHFQKLVSSKRAILTLMSVLGILSAWNLLTPAPAYALFSIEDILGSAVGWVAFVLGYIIAYVGGVVIAMLVYSIGIILQLNTNIINTPAVQAGFSITLQFANLGFVLGVIIIAIATIIRYETYGMKQLLSRLIIAALLVNFSLVFAGGLLNFSDQLSGVFLRSLPGGGKGVNAFASAIGGAMSPQRYMLNNQGNSNLNTQENWSKWASAGAGTGRTLANILTPLVEIIFASAMILIIVVTIGAFFVMLTVRYIYLGLLLIIMPIAWLLWIFPNTRGQWTKWWKNFFKWTFFAPISLFFLWLAIITAEAMNNASKVDPLSGLGGLGYTPDITTNPAGQALSGFFGNLVNNILGSFLQGSIVVGLTVGGLLAAERFSIVGAHAALGAVKSVGNAAKGYVGRRGKQFGGRALRTLGIKGASEKMMRSNLGTGIWNTRIGKWANRLTLGIPKAYHHGAKIVVQKGGEGLQAVNIKTTGQLREEEAKILKKETAHATTKETANLWDGANDMRKMGLMEMAKDDTKLAEALVARGFGPEAKKLGARYDDNEHLWEEVDKASAFAGSVGHYQKAIDEDWAKKKDESEDKARKEASISKDEIKEAEKKSHMTPKEAGEKTFKYVKSIGATDQEALEKAGEEMEHHTKLQEKKKKYDDAREKIKKELEEKVETTEIDQETGEMMKNADGTPKMTRAATKRDDILAEKLKDVKKGDKVAYDKVFGDKEAFGMSKDAVNSMAAAFAEKMIYANKQLIPQILGKLNAKQLEGFDKLMRKKYNEAIENAGGEGTAEGRQLIKDLKKYESTLARFITGTVSETAGAPSPLQATEEEHEKEQGTTSTSTEHHEPAHPEGGGHPHS